MAEEKKRTTLYLDGRLMKEVKILAIKEEQSMSQIVEDLLRGYLERREKRSQ